jgi:hypothetical protein
MAVKPGAQLIGAHSVGARGTGVLLDAPERLGGGSHGRGTAPQARPSGVSETSAKTSDLPRAPAAFTWRPLLASGFATACRLALTAPPPMRFVYLASRLCLRLRSHPTSRRRSCHPLVDGAINLHRGLAPPSHSSCRGVHEVGPGTSRPHLAHLLTRPLRTACCRVLRLPTGC